jgi:phosphohistidine phosphatase
MKTLILIRHAKSDWNDLSISDFDRPLNNRGKRDAPVMAQRLADKKININLFISSPAKRARKTAEVFAEAYDKNKNEVVLIPDLYMASTSAFYKIIADTKNKFDSIAVFSHNPGITEVSCFLTNSLQIGSVPTCGVVAVKIQTDDWKNFAEAPKELMFFDFPKNEL